MSSAKEDSASVDGGGGWGGGGGMYAALQTTLLHMLSVKLRLHSTMYSLFPRVTFTELNHNVRKKIVSLDVCPQ